MDRFRGKKQKSIYDTAIHVRVKRFDKTFFILCDEYETVQTLKGRVIDIFLFHEVNETMWMWFFVYR